MTEENKTNNEIKDAFKDLGKNLKKAVNSAWDSEERTHVQEQIEYGLSDLGSALETFVQDVSNTDAGQKLKDGAEDFGERLRSGEVEKKAKADLVKAIDYLNEQLDKLSDKFNSKEE
jgi:hypothetical protein